MSSGGDSRASGSGSGSGSRPASPPPPLEEAKRRLQSAAAAAEAAGSAASFDLMRTFASGTQAEVEALRRAIRLGMVNVKELDGMAAVPYLAKAVPSFLLAFLRRQGCGPELQEALQAGLAAARRKLEKEQSRSRLWKATDGILPQKVAKALLGERAEEVLAWIIDTFEHG